MGDTTTVITMAAIDEKLAEHTEWTVNEMFGYIESWFANEDEFLEGSKVLEAVKAFLQVGIEDPVVLEHRLDELRVEIYKWTDLDQRMNSRYILLYIQDNSLEKFKLLVEKISQANVASGWLSEIKNIVQGLARASA